MINEHANQNIWQAGVKQFINGMPKPFRDKHGIAIVHQRLGMCLHGPRRQSLDYVPRAKFPSKDSI